jgi:hypothetical protein
MNEISAYMQCFSNKRAVFECLKSFRKYYPSVAITLVSDGGDDFNEIKQKFNLIYKYSNQNILPQGKMCGIDGVEEYFKRIYEHCISVNSEWVVILEEDVITLRNINYFPTTECAGPRLNSYSPELTNFLIKNYGDKQYGYGMCGGSIFKRKSFIDAFNKFLDLKSCVQYDNRITGWSDIPLTLIFHLAGLDYSVWHEISEKTHPSLPIIRDGAFDHAYKYWYGKEYNLNMLKGEL